MRRSGWLAAALLSASVALVGWSTLLQRASITLQPLASSPLAWETAPPPQLPLAWETAPPPPPPPLPFVWGTSPALSSPPPPAFFPLLPPVLLAPSSIAGSDSLPRGTAPIGAYIVAPPAPPLHPPFVAAAPLPPAATVVSRDDHPPTALTTPEAAALRFVQPVPEEQRATAAHPSAVGSSRGGAAHGHARAAAAAAYGRWRTARESGDDPATTTTTSTSSAERAAATAKLQGDIMATRGSGAGVALPPAPSVLRVVSEGRAATASARGNLGPPEVVTAARDADWLRDRWQAAIDMSGRPLGGAHWLRVEVRNDVAHKDLVSYLLRCNGRGLRVELGRACDVAEVVIDFETAYAAR